MVDKEWVIEKVAAQNKWRKAECINLIASENVTSPLVDAVYNSDFSHRYAEGDPFKRYYNGTHYIDELEDEANKLALKLFDCKHVDLRVISGTVANIGAFSAFIRTGDLALTNSTQGGGHISHNFFGAVGMLGGQTIPFPLAEDGYHLDVDKTNKLIEDKGKNIRNHLSTVVFGCSMFLFPQPVKEIAPTAKAHGARVLYDAAHVLGLVAAKEFQDPLREGAELVTASTHKTFFGPQGGIIFNNLPDDFWEKMRSMVFPGVTSNHHLHRIPAMLIAMLEFQEFGKAYAQQVRKNAKALAQALHENGFAVAGEQFGFTQSHQVVLDVSTLGGGSECANKLEASNIICNKNLLPSDKLSAVQNPSGIRLGVQEMTRWGCKEGEMKEIAELMKKVLFDGQKVRDTTIDFRKRFNEVHYTFD